MPRPPAAVSPPPSQSRSVSLSSLRETERLPPARTRAHTHIYPCECVSVVRVLRLGRWFGGAMLPRAAATAGPIGPPGRGPYHETISPNDRAWGGVRITKRYAHGALMHTRHAKPAVGPTGLRAGPRNDADAARH